MSPLGPTLRVRIVVASILGCTILAAGYLFAADEPTPSEAAAGQVLGNFGVSAPSDPPPNFSLDMRAHMESGALHIEKLEFFYEPGTVPAPTLTKGTDGSAYVHVWVTKPRFRLISTKCEFVRAVRFSIPRTELFGAKKLVLINHDTGATQVLAESESLGRLLREPEVAWGQSKWNSSLSGSGCGA